jgi:hypothetical protein
MVLLAAPQLIASAPREGVPAIVRRSPTLDEPIQHSLRISGISAPSRAQPFGIPDRVESQEPRELGVAHDLIRALWLPRRDQPRFEFRLRERTDHDERPFTAGLGLLPTPESLEYVVRVPRHDHGVRGRGFLSEE